MINANTSMQANLAFAVQATRTELTVVKIGEMAG